MTVQTFELLLKLIDAKAVYAATHPSHVLRADDGPTKTEIEEMEKELRSRVADNNLLGALGLGGL